LPQRHDTSPSPPDNSPNSDDAVPQAATKSTPLWRASSPQNAWFETTNAVDKWVSTVIKAR